MKYLCCLLLILVPNLILPDNITLQKKHFQSINFQAHGYLGMLNLRRSYAKNLILNTKTY